MGTRNLNNNVVVVVVVVVFVVVRWKQTTGYKLARKPEKVQNENPVGCMKDEKEL